MHYVAYVQYADGVWRKFGDSVVSEVSFHEVAQRQAYVATYMLSSHVINEQNGQDTSGPAFGEKNGYIPEDKRRSNDNGTRVSEGEEAPLNTSVAVTTTGVE